MNEYEKLRDALSALPDTAEVSVLGRTLLGRDIPLVTLGKGERAVLYVAAASGTDVSLSSLLLEFVREYLAALSRHAVQYGYPMDDLFRERRIYILPMLNPDGACYVADGVCEDNPLCERVRVMNGGEDFSAWRANARGVELSRNFASGFAAGKIEETKRGITGGAPRGFGGEYPESEPESAALCRFLRANHAMLSGVLELRLHTRKGIRCSCEDNLTAKCVATGRVLSRFTGLPFLRENTGATGALADWCVRTLSRPAFELYCGEIDDGAAHAALFATLRRLLFSFPYML